MRQYHVAHLRKEVYIMKIGIIGLGLMGGSFGRTLVKEGEHTVYGRDISEQVMTKAQLLRAMNEPLTKENIGEVDLLITAVTPNKVRGILEEVVPQLKKGAVVNDFCGIKRGVVDIMKEFSTKYPDITFIGGHPMAGREFSGIDHSTTTLFNNASMILVNVNADIFQLESIKKFYLSVGFKTVEICSSDEHDEIIAFTSQLCHVVSNAFIKNTNAEKHYGFSAGSYKDMTRVARLDADMWGNLMTENADKLLPELDQLIDHLTEYRNALSTRNKEELTKLLADGNRRKLEID